MTNAKSSCLTIKLCVSKWLIFNWIIRDTQQYLEPFNFVDLCKIEFLEIELFDHLTVCKQMTDFMILWIVIYRSTWNHLNVCKRMSLGSIKNIVNKMCLQIIYM